MKRILIVDDAAFMRLTLRKILEKGGFEVAAEAENGAKGVAQYKALNPDLVTMDITMPELDGISALKEIMAFDPGAKVVMVSAMGQEGMVRDAVLNGAKTFIVKPFKEEFIIETIKKVATM